MDETPRTLPARDVAFNGTPPYDPRTPGSPVGRRPLPVPIREVAAQLGYAKADPVYALLNGRKLRGYLINGRWKVYQTDIDAFLDSTANFNVLTAPAVAPATTAAKPATPRSRKPAAKSAAAGVTHARPGGRPPIDRNRRIHF